MVSSVKKKLKNVNMTGVLVGGGVIAVVVVLGLILGGVIKLPDSDPKPTNPPSVTTGAPVNTTTAPPKTEQTSAPTTTAPNV